MYKDFRYINAGQNEFHRWGKKAIARAKSYLTPNENGFYSMPADGGNYYTIGTSTGKYGEFARFGETYLSVNRAGNVWAKVGTDKADAFVSMVNWMIKSMEDYHAAQAALHNKEDDEEDDED